MQVSQIDHALKNVYTILSQKIPLPECLASVAIEYVFDEIQYNIIRYIGHKRRDLSDDRDWRIIGYQLNVICIMIRSNISTLEDGYEDYMPYDLLYAEWVIGCEEFINYMNNPSKFAACLWKEADNWITPVSPTIIPTFVGDIVDGIINDFTDHVEKLAEWL